MIFLDEESVALTAVNGKYLCNEQNGERPLIANRTEIGPWETFQLININGGHVALKASNGKYVCNENNGGAPLQANREKVASWETFEVILIA